MRKSPHKHDVRAHTRNKRPVHKYVRGKGRKPPQPVGRQRRKVGEVNPGGQFDVSIYYVGEASERFRVEAKDDLDALDASIESRERPSPPSKIRLREVS